MKTIKKMAKEFLDATLAKDAPEFQRNQIESAYILGFMQSIIRSTEVEKTMGAAQERMVQAAWLDEAAEYFELFKKENKGKDNGK